MSEFVYSNDNLSESEPVSNKPETIWGIVITCIILSWICVCLRLYVRFKIVHAAGWDDLCVVLYLLTITAGSIAICLAVTYGLGKHFLQLESWQYKGFLKTFYVANATYVTSTALIKEALLLQYLRVFDRATFIRRFVVALIVFTALWGFAYSFLAWVPCVPVHDYWSGKSDPYCYGYGSQSPAPLAATFESHAAINMVLDIMVLSIPLPLLFENGTSSSARVRLAALLSMGILVLVFATWRFVTLVEHDVATWPTRDPTWYGPISIILTILEVDAASVCASVPIFWPVLRDMGWGKIFVTKEINITRETRYVDNDQDRLTHGTTNSITGSEMDLGCGGGRGWGKQETHCHESYVLSQVNPFRPSIEQTQTCARSDVPKNSAKKWIKI
ncbi:uncharacterized protein F4812DRAFT_1488 [Daldinia caldariorum]|uniref:uncharacterized protein n=1 Tax=Daldinia caldariorum TaxID=326644 RepID=UPI00200748E4|nr:uncharacterized protein F4812DRAFT_1488 [Daldinia caldariorum]KAI1472158.1 hypothetical protein F4812DRAFT_1488 [Daldinia caldariorum]